jgi:hypothetical protein
MQLHYEINVNKLFSFFDPQIQISTEIHNGRQLSPKTLPKITQPHQQGTALKTYRNLRRHGTNTPYLRLVYDTHEPIKEAN